VLEATAIGQLEFGSCTIWFFLPLSIDPAAGAVGVIFTAPKLFFGAQRRRFSVFCDALLAHRLALHFDPMSIVDQAVQDSIG
jgi:hypothetical protein